MQQFLGEIGDVVGLGSAHFFGNVLRHLVVEHVRHVGIEHCDANVEQLVLYGFRLLGRGHVHDAHNVRAAAADGDGEHRHQAGNGLMHE